MSGRLSAMRFALPVFVSAGLIAILLSRIDFATALSQLNANVAAVLIPALLVYGGASWWLEAVSLRRVTPSAALDTWTCAKVKAASYPLALLHYALGAGGLAYLLGRRGGLGFPQAAGAVMLISLFDLGLLLVLTALGAAFVASDAPEVRGGLVLVAVAGIALGFGFLRAPFSWGNLDWIRDLEIFGPARQVPLPVLLQLCVLRLAFVLVFIGLGAGAFAAFAIPVPVPEMVVGMGAVALVAALPIAVAGLGTGQVAFVYFFRHWADAETLLACSLTLTAAMIVMRAGMGLLFAREYAREAYVAVSKVEAPEVST